MLDRTGLNKVRHKTGGCFVGQRKSTNVHGLPASKVIWRHTTCLDHPCILGVCQNRCSKEQDLSAGSDPPHARPQAPANWRHRALRSVLFERGRSHWTASRQLLASCTVCEIWPQICTATNACWNATTAGVAAYPSKPDPEMTTCSASLGQEERRLGTEMAAFSSCRAFTSMTC